MIWLFIAIPIAFVFALARAAGNADERLGLK